MLSMNFRRKKTYGTYKTSTCPFCSRVATHKNEQGLDVCHQHLKEQMQEFKCTCGSWLELRTGKFGAYFNCMRCGNMPIQKGMEIRGITRVGLPEGMEDKSTPKAKSREKKDKTETTISTDDVEYFS